MEFKDEFLKRRRVFVLEFLAFYASLAVTLFFIKEFRPLLHNKEAIFFTIWTFFVVFHALGFYRWIYLNSDLTDLQV